MAGRGPAPKDPSRRARRNKDTQEYTQVRFEKADQPELPEEIPWPEATRRWWAMWASSPLTDMFGATDWDFLLDTALLHANYWAGDLSSAAELRLRVAKFGATPEDRARLRIQFAEADDVDPQEHRRPATTSRERYGNVTKLPHAAG